MRLFIGAPLPQQMMEEILSFQQKHQDVERVRWVSRKNLHVTTLFIGHIEANDLAEIQDTLETLCKDIKHFGIRFERFCYAPKLRDPKMIWVRFQREDKFTELVSALRAGLGSFLDSQESRKDPVPHVTIARLKNFSHLDKISMNARIGEQQLSIKELNLWESVLDPDGAIYTVKASYKLY